MRKVISLFLTVIMVFSILTAGCQNHSDYQDETVVANFEFDLPDAYKISEKSDNSCVIYKGAEIVGGITLTNLNNGKIADIDKFELRQYLDLFAPSPLTYEYVAMYCSDKFDYVSINFTVTDPDTKETTYYHHYLFERAGGCYDLWMTDELIAQDEQISLLELLC